MQQDEVLKILDDVMENGNSIPPKVSNRLLLAATRKNYRLSATNSEKIDRNIKEVKDFITPKLEEDRVELRLHRWLLGAILLLIGILHGLPLLGLLP